MNEENEVQNPTENDEGANTNTENGSGSGTDTVEGTVEDGTQEGGEQDAEGAEEGIQTETEGEGTATEGATTSSGGEAVTAGEGFAGSEEYLALIEEIHTLQDIGRGIHESNIMLLMGLGFALGAYLIHDLFEGLRKL